MLQLRVAICNVACKREPGGSVRVYKHTFALQPLSLCTQAAAVLLSNMHQQALASTAGKTLRIEIKLIPITHSGVLFPMTI